MKTTLLSALALAALVASPADVVAQSKPDAASLRVAVENTTPCAAKVLVIAERQTLRTIRVEAFGRTDAKISAGQLAEPLRYVVERTSAGCSWDAYQIHAEVDPAIRSIDVRLADEPSLSSAVPSKRTASRD